MSFNNLQDTQTLWGKCLELDTLSKAVMQVLINHRNSTSGLCAPGMSLVAKETGMSLRSVKARIASLTESGHLKIIERGTFSTANRYAIDLGSAGDALGEADALGVGQEMHHPSCTGRTTPSAGDAPKQISKQINQQIKNKEEGFAAPAARSPFEAGASIPADYSEIAAKAGIEDPQRVFSAFVDHALATGRRLVDWKAGFRVWCSRELNYHPTAAVREETQRRQQQATVERALARIAEEQRQAALDDGKEF